MLIRRGAGDSGHQAQRIKNMSHHSGHRLRNTIFAQSNQLIAMSILNAVINNVEDEALREDLQERVDIILHKIKFMDKVPVCCLDKDGGANPVLDLLVEAAGGAIQKDPLQAQVLICHQTQSSMVELMGYVPAMLVSEWPAVLFNRVYLMEDTSAFLSDPESFVSALEDMSEMLHPGYFVFGNEGVTWTAFGV